MNEAITDFVCILRVYNPLQKSALLKEGTTSLQYGPKQGSPYFREQLAKFLSKGYNDSVGR